MEKSLGLIETIGLTAGIEAADAAVKAANVKLVGYELAKGSGMTTIKVEGEVGAVQAAVSAAKAAAAKVGQVVSAHVIARPDEGIRMLIGNPDTVGFEKDETVSGTHISKEKNKKEAASSVAVDDHDKQNNSEKKEDKQKKKK